MTSFCEKCENLEYQYDILQSKSTWKKWCIKEGITPCECEPEPKPEPEPAMSSCEQCDTTSCLAEYWWIELKNEKWILCDECGIAEGQDRVVPLEPEPEPEPEPEDEDVCYGKHCDKKSCLKLATGWNRLWGGVADKRFEVNLYCDDCFEKDCFEKCEACCVVYPMTSLNYRTGGLFGEHCGNNLYCGACCKDIEKRMTLPDEDEIVVNEFWYESKLYYIDDEDNIYDETNLRKIGKILSGSVFIVDERLVKASDEKIECYIKARDKWTSYAMNPKYDKALYHAFGIRALICETTIKMGQIEKLIYKSIINGKQDLNLKYKEKYLSHIQQALEYWGTLNEMGAEDEGKYLMKSNKLKEDYDFVDTLTKAFV